MHSVLNHRLNKLQSYSLPSARYIDLTLGSLGSIYEAPADGYFSIDVIFDTNHYLFAANIKGYRGSEPWNYSGRVIALSSYSDRNDCSLTMTIPAKKGDGIVINYNDYPKSIRIFRFIYAVGSAPA